MPEPSRKCQIIFENSEGTIVINRTLFIDILLVSWKISKKMGGMDKKFTIPLLNFKFTSIQEIKIGEIYHANKVIFLFLYFC